MKAKYYVLVRYEDDELVKLEANSLKQAKGLKQHLKLKSLDNAEIVKRIKGE